MKKFLKLFSLMFISLVLVGCNNNLLNNNLTGDNDTSKKMNGKCNYLDCINEISDTASVEDINNIIGIDGKLIDDKYNQYEWAFNDEISLYATYYNNSYPTIEIDYYEEDIMNKKVDLSDLDGLKIKVNKGISYNEFKQYIGNVEGTLIEKSKYTKRYIWVNKDGGYVKGSFNNRNECTFFTGMAK